MNAAQTMPTTPAPLYDPNSPSSLEKYSSAITLSDMEVFIFPELLFALVLANIMSPALWRWKDDSWFAGVDALNQYRRLLRAKQYIIDKFSFNLDLDTWGLTTKEKELARFSSFISQEALAQSNALFGYEGDKYYFNIDIRRHFGLDKYTSDVIPYWKTETIEAMEAFRHKQGYSGGAGECVSLSTLYASALFVVARVPLEQIYLMATPLHSQNFVDINDTFLGDHLEIRASEVARSAGEVLVDELTREANGLEGLCTGVRGDRRDAHLRHHLQDALSRGLDVVLDRRALGGHAEVAPTRHLGDRLDGEVGVHGRCAVADEQGHVVHLPRFARLDDKAGASPGPLRARGGDGPQRSAVARGIRREFPEAWRSERMTMFAPLMALRTSSQTRAIALVRPSPLSEAVKSPSTTKD